MVYGFACAPANRPAGTVGSADAASKVYVAPGQHDEFYAFMSGGFNGQIGVYGLPSGRLLKIIPVFSQFPENGWGYSEETKPMLETTFGNIPWDDLHHTALSQTNGEDDGRWIFVNANNTPRVARVDLNTFEASEILQIPNSGGNHGSPFITSNSEYVIASTRFSVPIPQADVPIADYKKAFKGTISFIAANEPGKMDVAFQLLVPGYDYDLARAGKGPSKDWVFLTSYNSEQAYEKLEINASKADKDFIAAINWKRLETCAKTGKAENWPVDYVHNVMDEFSRVARSETKKSVKMLTPQSCPNSIFFLPTPKSPHGADVDPSGEYIVAGGKLATVIPVHSFTKLQQAIKDQAFETEISGIPVLKYDAILAGEVKDPGLGPLHTEFDGKGYAYTSVFISSEIVKWKLGTWEVVDRTPTYYSVGHLMIPGGATTKPSGKYAVALNKITKDRYLPTGPELTQSAQLYDISGEKMKLILDFPTTGEPHYANAILASKIEKQQKKYYSLAENRHPQVAKAERDAGIERTGKVIHVRMTAIRSHFAPDNIEGVQVGDTVLFHITNLEQDWDIPHGFAIQGAINSELLIMPGETRTLKWIPRSIGVFPMYCTDFCSALHQEMQGYVRVSPVGSSVPLTANTLKAKGQVARAAQRGITLPTPPGAGTGPVDAHAVHTTGAPRPR
ncbi:Sec-dependent nitrous-oxide reductase [Gemmatimonas sp.]|jgi:nitrous-oxide reductase|uniref:Sec-dependent nitrous-oxide reductase n=1 Tax=Gemmatimonas sp. TaxID=1962908 RepID=UPI0037C0BC5C